MSGADDLAGRMQALRAAATEARGRVDDAIVDRAQEVVDRADRRLQISGDATVVALGGATGSGKSSLFNALTGTNLAHIGVRRPTTSTAMAVTFGGQPRDDLLNWLDIRIRHSLGARARYAEPLDGLVLLDLPDHDSTEKAHRDEVDRLVQLVDMLIWVVDPQKYADAALHENYLVPLARYAGVMMIVLNQVDRLSEAERKHCLKDLRQILDSEGLAKAELVSVSAVSGEGIHRLRDRISERVSAKKVVATRLGEDVRGAAARLAEHVGTTEASHVPKPVAQRLNRTLAEAAGVPVVTDAVAGAWRHRGSLATGWPALSWIGKFRPDPLRRLHLDRLGVGQKKEQKSLDPARVSRTSLPATTSVQQARVDSALRDLSDECSRGLTRHWQASIRAASRSYEAKLPDRLDRAIATTDLGLDRDHGWWGVVKVLQWILIAAVVVGLTWLGIGFLLLYLQMPPLPSVHWWGIPAPTVLVLGGVLAGLIVAGLARLGVEVGARSKQRRARSALLAAIDQVTRGDVVAPVDAEVDRYNEVRRQLARVLR